MIEVDGALVPDYPIPAAAQGAARDIPYPDRHDPGGAFLFLQKLLSRVLDIGSILKSDRNRESAETRQRIREAYRRVWTPCGSHDG